MLNSTRTGRRPGRATGTREAILASARRLFAARGYDGTSVRAVALSARVDPALVLHFFGGKQELFGEALQLPVDASAIEGALEGPKATLGQRIATLYVRIVFREGARVFHSLLRSIANPEAAAMLCRAIESTLLATFTRVFRGPEAALRAELVASHMVGLFITRRILRIEPIASLDDDRVIAMVAPALQRYLADPLPGSPR